MKVHRIWIQIHFHRTLQQHEGWSTYLCIQGIEFFSENFPVVQFSIKLLCLCKIVQDLIHRHIKLFQATEGLKFAICDTFPGKIPKREIVPLDLFSIEKKKWEYRVKRILVCFFTCVKELFKLGMCYLNALDLFYNRSETQVIFLTEFFTKWTRYHQKLDQDKVYLVKKMENQKELIDHFLRFMNSSKTAEEIIQSVKSLFTLADLGYCATNQTIKIVKEISKPLISCEANYSVISDFSNAVKKKKREASSSPFPKWHGSCSSLNS